RRSVSGISQPKKCTCATSGRHARANAAAAEGPSTTCSSAPASRTSEYHRAPSTRGTTNANASPRARSRRASAAIIGTKLPAAAPPKSAACSTRTLERAVRAVPQLREHELQRERFRACVGDRRRAQARAQQTVVLRDVALRRVADLERLVAAQKVEARVAVLDR